MEINSVSIDRCIGKENVVCMSEIQFICKKKRHSAIGDNMNKSSGHYAKWNKLHKDKCFMISLTCGI